MTNDDDLKDGFYEFGYLDDDTNQINKEGLIIVKDGKMKILRDDNNALRHILAEAKGSLSKAKKIMEQINRQHYAAFVYSPHSVQKVDKAKKLR